MTIPLTGENLSWRKTFKANWTTSPTTAIANLQCFPTGVPAGLNFYTHIGISYVQASSADQSGIPGFTDTPANKALYNQAAVTATAPFTVNSGTVLSNPSTGTGTQEYTETQMSVLASYAGGAGAATGTTFFFRYNEY